MNGSKEDQGTAEKNRILAREGKLKLAPLKRLSIPSVIDDDDPEGLLPTGSQNESLTVCVPERWPNYAIEGETDTLELYWDRPNRTPQLIDSVPIPGPIAEDFSYELTVPKNLLHPDGRFEVWYAVVISAGGPGAPSEHRFVTVDSEPPSYDKQLEELLYPSNLPDRVITEEYLQDNNDKVEFRLPQALYTGAADRDVLELFWSVTNPPIEAFVSTKTILQAEIDARDIRVDLKGDDIRAANQNGTFYAFYKLRDR